MLELNFQLPMDLASIVLVDKLDPMGKTKLLTMSDPSFQMLITAVLLFCFLQLIN